MQLAFIQGRIPALAQKEIEAVATILPFPWSSSMIAPNILLLKEVTVEGGEPTSYSEELLPILDQLQRRLGSVSSIVRLVDSADRSTVVARLAEMVMSEAPSSKLDFGVSIYGNANLGQPGIAIKKALKAAGLSVRYVAPKEGNQLSSAQVYHNRLAVIGAHGNIQSNRELVAIADGGMFRIGYTLTVQDIEAYSRRDFGLPAADSASGMLPPKVAQTMINLAKPETEVYDPFCGNGRVVLEAALMGFKATGSDLDAKKVESSRTNLTWLAQEEGVTVNAQESIIQLDARKALIEGKTIVGEPYLGAPLRRPLPLNQKTAWLNELASLYESVFTAWAKQKPRVIVLVFPAAKLEGGGEAALYPHLVDRLAALGYSSSVLGRYTRPDALISRDIVTITHG